MRGEPLTYRFVDSDHPKQLHDVGVSELPIDGRLLQEPDSVLTRRTRLQHLNGHHSGGSGGVPDAFIHCTKLARAQVLCGPDGHTEMEQRMNRYSRQ